MHPIPHTTTYPSPLGTITLACDDEALLGLWFNEHNDIPTHESHPILSEAMCWLDIYFSGKCPNFLPPMKYDSTSFGKRVCDIMLTIPYGQTMTYGQIAVRMARAMGVEHMSAQAVGRAVGRNPIAIMIPCHRVVGAHGNLTGYAGGIERKISLLEIEGVDMKGFFVPSRSRK